MFNFKLICLVIYLFIFPGVKLELSDKRLCANEDCTQKISLARTMMKFPSPEKGILSFGPNTEVTVYSKSAGSNKDLWGVEINGVRGYAPRRFLRETRIFVKDLQFLRDIEPASDQQVPSTNSDTGNIIKADKVPEATIVDGTTLFDDTIAPTSTENPVLSTDTVHNLTGENETLDLDNFDVNNQETEPLDLKTASTNNNEENGQRMGNGDEVDIEDEDDYEEDDDEDMEDDNYDSEEENDVDDGSEDDSDEKSNDTDKENRDISVKSVPVSESGKNIEDSVKLRQLLSDKVSSENSAIEETEKREEVDRFDGTIKKVGNDMVITLEKAPSKAENVSVDSKENIENVSSEGVTSTDIPKPVETVTESAFVQISNSEIPVPYDNQDHVTPNPIEVDAFETVTPLIMKIKQNTQEEENIRDTVEKQNEGVDVKEENQSPEDVKMIQDDSEKIVGVSTHESIGKTPETDVNEVNIRETLPSDTPNENTTLQQPLEKPDLDSSKDTIEEQTEKVQNIESVPENKIEDIKSPLQSIDPAETPIFDTTPELKSGDQSNVIPEKEDEANTAYETEKEPVNISQMLSGIANLFSAAVKDEQVVTADKIDDTVKEDQGESVENEFGETNVPLSKTEDVLEKHEHSFVTIFDDIQKSTPSTEDPQKIETGEDVTEAPIQEKLIEEKQEKEQEDVAGGDTIEVPTLEEKVAEKVVEELHQQQDIILETMLERPKEIVEEYRPAEVVEEVNHDKDVIEEPPEIPQLPVEEMQEQHGFESIGESRILDIHEQLLSKNTVDYGSCPSVESDCTADMSLQQQQLEMEQMDDKSTIYTDFVNLFTLLGVTGLSVALFLLGFIKLDKSRKEGTLIAKINSLEKALLVASKENALLADRVIEIQNETAAENERISTEEYENLNRIYQETLSAKSALEEQVQSLDKELENSTEVGLELNRMLQDILSSQNGSDILIANVEQLQRQLVEQQSTINTINDTLNLKDTENHELQLELEIKNKKVTHLQTELDKMAMNLFKAEEDKEQTQAKLEVEIVELKGEMDKNKSSFNSTKAKLSEEIEGLKSKIGDLQRNLEVKSREYGILKENFNNVQVIKNNSEALESLLNTSAMKAELQQLQRDNQNVNDNLRQEKQTRYTLEKQIEVALGEAKSYKAKYDEADKEKLESKTKLEVLSNYFKEREAQLQKELSKQESLWVEKQGEASSTVERIKYMQEELQNYKAQNELLKQEIVSQEVELKSRISVLEKKAHESWLTARQAERRLEDVKQEAAQLRNRLTLKERSFIEEKSHRLQSPLEQNGDVAISPLHMPVDTPASPPLLYGTRDHLTTSPPLPNLPPFLPPPPGVPFMPPPIPGVPGFMPPPPSMFPGDHRPPPLGRMSPPIGSRYSPDSRYSPYDRNSPSPPYDDEYGSSPPPLRGYSPYNNRDDRRDYKRGPPPPTLRANGRNKGAMSSGSGNSNESIEKISRHHHSKV